MGNGMDSKDFKIQTVRPETIGELDRTWPYNDNLLYKVTNEDGTWDLKMVNDLSVPNLSVKHLRAYGEPPTIEEVIQYGKLQPGDQFMRLGENGPVISRRPFYLARVQKPEVNMEVQASPEAIALMTACTSNFDQTKWKRVEQVGPDSSALPSFTWPWNLSTRAGAKKLEAAVACIRTAKEDGTLNGESMPASVATYVSGIDDGVLEILDRQVESHLEATAEADHFSAYSIGLSIIGVLTLIGVFVVPSWPAHRQAWRQYLGIDKKEWVKGYMETNGVDKATAERVYDEVKAAEKYGRVSQVSRTAWVKEYAKLAGVDETKALEAYQDMKNRGLDMRAEDVHALKKAEAIAEGKGPDDDDTPPTAGAGGGSGSAVAADSAESTEVSMAALPPDLAIYANQSLADGAGTAIVNGVEIQLPVKWGHLAGAEYTVAEFYSLTGASASEAGPAQPVDSLFAGATAVYRSSWDTLPENGEAATAMPYSPQPYGIAGARFAAPGRVLGARGFRIPVRVPVP